MITFNRLVLAWKHRQLATHLALVFGSTVLVAMLCIVFYVNHQAVGIVQDASQTLFDHTANESRSQIDKSVSAVDSLLSTYAADPQGGDFGSASQRVFIQRLSVSLKASPLLSAFYIGFDDGGFVLLRQLTSPVARQKLDAPDTARYFLEIVRTGAQAARMELTFLDDQLNTVGTAAAPATPYDPRTRGWYQAAIGSEASILTDPYWFFVTQERGVTLARRLASGHGVVGADLGLADLSQALQQMKSTKSSALMIVNPNGEVIASSEPIKPDTSGDPGAMPSWPASSIAVDMLEAATGAADEQAQTRTIDKDGVTWVMRTVPLHAGPWTFRMVTATPANEMLAGARELVSTLVWLGVAMAIAAMVVIQIASKAVSRPLVQLAREAERMQRLQFKPETDEAPTSVREIQTLSQSMRQAGCTIQRFIEIGQALSAERDPMRLMGRLLQETITIAEAEGGLLLLTEDRGETLSVIDRNTLAEGIESRPIGRHDVDGHVLQALADKAVAHFDCARAVLPAFLSSLVDAKPLANDQVFRFSVVPLLNHSEEVIGGLLLAARIEAGMEMPDANLELVRALSGTAAMTIEMTLLLKARKSLLDAVIRMIANSIDAKSPYTSGHCQRVPLLTTALVHAASQSRSGPFEGFSLSQDEWEAVKVASWLHDCGKLTTAEYIVDKATKLETIYDRLHEIRMRFELLKANAWTAYWRGVAEGGNPQTLAVVRDADLAALDDDFSFVAACNEGGEAMAPQDIERLQEIGDRKWIRTLDDRIGTSREEQQRKNRMPTPALPVEERLLDDRVDHLIEHYDSRLGTLENQADFSLKPLPYRLNLGERYNLSIGRGTLTAEERYEINRHITHTILMLQDLPLTGALRLVPEFAGGHHEKMDGTGYPNGLRRDDMSIVARIMAIADVFEALTAADRPYKKAKKLSEVVRIMGFMKRDRHLDPDLLDLFLTEGIWRDYAREFMSPELIDEPDVESVLAIKVA
ncbi:MAG TPA: HD domain-containing phosphohydrolase [Bordetella sp.]